MVSLPAEGAGRALATPVVAESQGSLVIGMRRYRSSGRARVTAQVTSQQALAAIIASGTVFRVDPVPKIELTTPGETVSSNGVLIHGALDIASTVPTHASQMFGRNVLTLLQHLMKDGAIAIDLSDEIAGPMCIVHQGQPRTP